MEALEGEVVRLQRDKGDLATDLTRAKAEVASCELQVRSNALRPSLAVPPGRPRVFALLSDKGELATTLARARAEAASCELQARDSAVRGGLVFLMSMPRPTGRRCCPRRAALLGSRVACSATRVTWRGTWPGPRQSLPAASCRARDGALSAQPRRVCRGLRGGADVLDSSFLFLLQDLATDLARARAEVACELQMRSSDACTQGPAGWFRATAELFVRVVEEDMAAAQRAAGQGGEEGLEEGPA